MPHGIAAKLLTERKKQNMWYIVIAFDTTATSVYLLWHKNKAIALHTTMRLRPGSRRRESLPGNHA